MNDQPRSVSEAVAAADGGGPTVTIAAGKPFEPRDPKDRANRKPPKQPEGLPEPAPKVDDIPPWDQAAVRSALLALTGATDAAVGESVGAQLTMTDDELRQIVPPLTNIINRTPKLRAMSSASDAVALALGMIGYSMRVASEASDTAKARKAERARLTDREDGATFENVEVVDGLLPDEAGA